MDQARLDLSNSLTVGFDAVYFFTRKYFELFVRSPFSVFKSRKYMSLRPKADFYYEPKFEIKLLPRAVLEPRFGLCSRYIAVLFILSIL